MASENNLRKVSTVLSPAELIQANEDLLANGVERIYQSNQGLFERKIIDQASINFEGSFFGAVRLAMSIQRLAHDTDQALRKLREYTNKLYPGWLAIRQTSETLVGQENLDVYKVGLSEFHGLMVCAVLLKDWELALKEIQYARSSPAVAALRLDGQLFYHFAQALMELVSPQCAVEELPFLNMKKKLPDSFIGYPELFRAILEGNQNHFDQELQNVIERFAKRAKSRVDAPMGFGYGKHDHAECFDYRATFAAICALRAGLKLNVDSEYVPKAFVFGD